MWAAVKCCQTRGHVFEAKGRKRSFPVPKFKIFLCFIPLPPFPRVTETQLTFHLV